MKIREKQIKCRKPSKENRKRGKERKEKMKKRKGRIEKIKVVTRKEKNRNNYGTQNNDKELLKKELKSRMRLYLYRNVAG